MEKFYVEIIPRTEIEITYDYEGSVLNAKWFCSFMVLIFMWLVIGVSVLAIMAFYK